MATLVYVFCAEGFPGHGYAAFRGGVPMVQAMKNAPAGVCRGAANRGMFLQQVRRRLGQGRTLALDKGNVPADG